MSRDIAASTSDPPEARRVRALVEEALAWFDALPLLAHCGEPFGEDWAVKIPDDWRNVLLTWRTNGPDRPGWRTAPQRSD